jgi:hypothetical protein
MQTIGNSIVELALRFRGVKRRPLQFVTDHPDAVEPVLDVQAVMIVRIRDG